MPAGALGWAAGPRDGTTVRAGSRNLCARVGVGASVSSVALRDSAGREHPAPRSGPASCLDGRRFLFYGGRRQGHGRRHPCGYAGFRRPKRSPGQKTEFKGQYAVGPPVVFMRDDQAGWRSRSTRAAWKVRGSAVLSDGIVRCPRRAHNAFSASRTAPSGSAPQHKRGTIGVVKNASGRRRRRSSGKSLTSHVAEGRFRREGGVANACA
jgi:hypothetical protein